MQGKLSSAEEQLMAYSLWQDRQPSTSCEARPHRTRRSELPDAGKKRSVKKTKRSGIPKSGLKRNNLLGGDADNRSESATEGTIYCSPTALKTAFKKRYDDSIVGNFEKRVVPLCVSFGALSAFGFASQSDDRLHGLVLTIPLLPRSWAFASLANFARPASQPETGCSTSGLVLAAPLCGGGTVLYVGKRGDYRKKNNLFQGGIQV
jgi:hypothetical protein